MGEVRKALDDVLWEGLVRSFAGLDEVEYVQRAREHHASLGDSRISFAAFLYRLDDEVKAWKLANGLS